MADVYRKIMKPFVKRNKWTPQQQGQHYKRVYNIFNRQQAQYDRRKIPAATEMTDVSVNMNDVQSEFGREDVGYWNQYVYQNEHDKLTRLSGWREMSVFPEISFALNEIRDEAINNDVYNNFIEFEITNPKFEQNDNIKINLVNEWDHIIHTVMNANMHAAQWFMEFMIDGEIFFEKVIDPTNARNMGIEKVKRLRTEYTYPIWEDIEDDEVNTFVHKRFNKILLMPKDMIAYANSGIYDKPDEQTKIVISYLDDAKISYRKLRQIEDAVVIYRLNRSVERRVFNIDVGGLPKGKAEQVLMDFVRRYRQRKTYDPRTGETSEAIDTKAMIEDFFLPKFGEGRGHTIDNLPEGQNLGQIQDILYFLDKLYRALKIPMSRMKADTGFSLGDTSDITREEVRFNKMVTHFTKRFATVFKSIFMSHLRLKGYVREYGISERDISVKLKSNNLFQEFLETNIFSNRSETFERFIQYSDPGENGQPPIFSKKWLMKRFLKLDEKDIVENDEYKKKEMEEYLAAGGGEGGDMGDEFGGGDFGGDDFGGGDMGGDDTPSSFDDIDFGDTSDIDAGGDTGADTAEDTGGGEGGDEEI
jgi:hypothetical protein